MHFIREKAMSGRLENCLRQEFIAPSIQELLINRAYQQAIKDLGAYSGGAVLAMHEDKIASQEALLDVALNQNVGQMMGKANGRKKAHKPEKETELYEDEKRGRAL